MKKLALVMIVGCLFMVPELAQAQVDKMIDRFFQKGDQREEGRSRPGGLRVVEMEFSPEPVRPGERVGFRMVITNETRRSGRINLAIKDRDQVISVARDVDINPGENRIDFPAMDYGFSPGDHCFTVDVEIEHNKRPMELARDFCARRTPAGWTLGGKGIGSLYVEDLDTDPDPMIPGQQVQFRVRLRNDGRPIRGNIRIQDKDQLVVLSENVLIPHGHSDFQFPYTRYSFQRSDHCFKVLVDIERTPYPVDAAREFCARPMGWTLRP